VLVLSGRDSTKTKHAAQVIQKPGRTIPGQFAVNHGSFLKGTRLRRANATCTRSGATSSRSSSPTMRLIVCSYAAVEREPELATTG
jgi:hypothetical protein